MDYIYDLAERSEDLRSDLKANKSMCNTNMSAMPAVTSKSACTCYRHPSDTEVGRVLRLVQKAFACLQRKSGFWCRECYGTCHRCSARLLSDEIREQTDTIELADYAFYTSDDVQHLATYGEMYIAYGNAMDDPEIFPWDIRTAVGKAVRDALAEAGLTVFWDLDGDHRILVRHAKHAIYGSGWQEIIGPVCAYGKQ